MSNSNTRRGIHLKPEQETPDAAPALTIASIAARAAALLPTPGLHQVTILDAKMQRGNHGENLLLVFRTDAGQEFAQSFLLIPDANSARLNSLSTKQLMLLVDLIRVALKPDGDLDILEAIPALIGQTATADLTIGKGRHVNVRGFSNGTL